MTVWCRDELVNIALQFQNVEKKTSWEAAFSTARQKLGKDVDHYYASAIGGILE